MGGGVCVNSFIQKEYCTSLSSSCSLGVIKATLEQTTYKIFFSVQIIHILKSAKFYADNM